MAHSLFDLKTPALLIELPRLKRNLQKMSALADRLQVTLRPHLKTHKCLEIGALQQQISSTPGVTVSTIAEARIFIDHGYSDLTWAFPLNPDYLDEVLSLARRSTLRLLVDNERALQTLEAAGVRLHVWLKVDCGYHRAGVDPDDPGSLDLAARLATSPVLQFDGILTHSGHAYYAESRQIMGEIAQQERDVMLGFAQRLHDAGVQVPAISIGSTPALAAIDHLDGIDEIRPGNYAFYDWTQVALGTCTESACALTVLASVVSASPNLDQSIIDAGALALSKDALIGPDQAVNWGHVYVDPCGSLRSRRSTASSIVMFPWDQE
jgi:D-serine deaminase-like pyridoxal phosphate-dependent protein